MPAYPDDIPAGAVVFQSRVQRARSCTIVHERNSIRFPADGLWDHRGVARAAIYYFIIVLMVLARVHTHMRTRACAFVSYGLAIYRKSYVSRRYSSRLRARISDQHPYIPPLLPPPSPGCGSHPPRGRKNKTGGKRKSQRDVAYLRLNCMSELPDPSLLLPPRPSFSHCFSFFLSCCDRLRRTVVAAQFRLHRETFYIIDLASRDMN